MIPVRYAKLTPNVISECLPNGQWEVKAFAYTEDGSYYKVSAKSSERQRARSRAIFRFKKMMQQEGKKLKPVIRYMNDGSIRIAKSYWYGTTTFGYGDTIVEAMKNLAHNIKMVEEIIDGEKLEPKKPKGAMWLRLMDIFKNQLK